MQTREKRGKTHSAKGAEDDHAPSMAAAMQTDRLLCKSGLLSYSETGKWQSPWRHRPGEAAAPHAPVGLPEKRGVETQKDSDCG